MSTLKTTNLQHASAASPAIVLAADGSATAQVSSLNGGPLAGARNRIINGDMRIDQRNNGAALSSSIGYPVDRFLLSSNAANFTYQRSAVAPVGFTNSCLITVSSSASPAAGDYRQFFQAIEGYNVADFNLGTASAIAFTLSFWVRSSVTGTYSGGFINGAATRSYVFTYQINAANTWEYKTVTITGDSSGTWLTDNGLGLNIRFDIGSGSTFTATAGSWQTGLFFKSSGSVNLSATNGATFYITGVQLEAGTVATPFERRSYGQELALCQRYYQKSYRPANVPGTATFEGIEWMNGANARLANTTRFAVQMRTAPGVVPYDYAGTANRVRTSAGDGQTGYNVRGPSENNFTLDYSSGGITEILYHWTASAEL